MTPANAEILYAHSKECGSHEFNLQITDGMKQYLCKQCGSQVAQEPDVEAPKKAEVPEVRKAA